MKKILLQLQQKSQIYNSVKSLKKACEIPIKFLHSRIRKHQVFFSHLVRFRKKQKPTNIYNHTKCYQHVYYLFSIYPITCSILCKLSRLFSPRTSTHPWKYTPWHARTRTTILLHRKEYGTCYKHAVWNGLSTSDNCDGLYVHFT
jgi:hypothetical protein